MNDSKGLQMLQQMSSRLEGNKKGNIREDWQEKKKMVKARKKKEKEKSKKNKKNTFKHNLGS
jgi:hypothetical protein